MKKSTKILITLLSATCIAVGSFGMTACGTKTGGNGGSSNEQTTGIVAYAKDQDGNTIADVYLELYKYQDYVKETIETLKTDANGKVIFKSIEKEDGAKYLVGLGTPDNGDRQCPYNYSAGDAVVVSDDNTATLVFEYSTSYNVSEIFELQYKRAGVTTVGSDEVKFVEGKYLAFNSSSDTTLSAQLDKSKTVESADGTYTLDLTIDPQKPSYFTFAPLVEPSTVASESADAKAETQKRVDAALLAAAGIYQFTIDVIDASGKVVSNGFADNGVVMQQYSFINYLGDGVPAYSTGTGTEKDVSYSGTNSFSCEWSKEYSSKTQQFGVTATSACTVRISVVRKGDAHEKIVDAKTVSPSSDSITKAENGKGTAILMPMDDTYAIVAGDDGYYHLSSKTGPLLYIALTKQVSDIGDYSVAEAYKHTGEDSNTVDNQFYVSSEVLDTEYDDGYHYVTYDYLPMIQAYAEQVNDDGLYPVNEDLMSFLKLFCTKAMRISQCTSIRDYGYLSLCMFYNDGTFASGEGSSSNPYVMSLGINSTVDMTNLNKKAYLTYKAENDGYYAVSSTGTIGTTDSQIGSEDKVTINRSLYVKLEKGKTYTFTVTGSSDAYTAMIKSVDQLAATEKQGNDSSGNSTTTSSGTSASSPLTITGINTYEVVMNPDVGKGDGVYIKWKVAPGGAGTYKFKVYGINAMVVYSGSETLDSSVLENCYNYENTLTIDAEANQWYYIFLTLNKRELDSNGKVFESSYILNIERYDISNLTQLTEGENTVVTDYDSTVEFAFSGAGTYKFVDVSNTNGITIKGEDVTVYNEKGNLSNSSDALYDGYTFTVAEGKTVIINVQSISSTDFECVFKLIKQD